MNTKQYIPMDIVCEALGCFTLDGNEEQQVAITEQLASVYYYNMDDLIQTVKGYAVQKTFAKEERELRKSEFFKPYF